MSATAEQRFWEKVDLLGSFLSGTDCWLWDAFVTEDGYGRFRYPNGQLAHRFSYETYVGPLPPAMTVDHRCFNTRCVRPEHLRKMTRARNSKNLRRVLDNRCFRGHKLTEENTLVGADGKRRCRQCRIASNRNYRRNKRAAEQLVAA